MRKVIFYREESGRWYIDLPEWKGSKAELEMVSGADVLLDLLYSSGGKTGMGRAEILVDLSSEKFDGSYTLSRTRIAPQESGGAFYRLGSYRGSYLNLEMWLCDVTKFVFGGFPEEIFIALN